MRDRGSGLILLMVAGMSIRALPQKVDFQNTVRPTHIENVLVSPAALRLRGICRRKKSAGLPMQTRGCHNALFSIILVCMNKGRLEAFSDGVIAILITIMVLELHVPDEADWHALSELGPTFFSYVLSFIFLGIYWNNHHHLLQVAKQVNGKVLWANLHLLFWLSLVPFVTAWMGGNGFAQLPVALYGVVLWMSGFSYYILARTLITLHGRDSLIDTVLRNKRKETLSLIAYALAIVLSFINPAFSLVLYIFVAVIWLIPDPRVEKSLRASTRD
jgi:uncharacterized membrane protein